MAADTMNRRHANPLTNPLHYASKQLQMGPPVSYATAQRALVGYDYGTSTPHETKLHRP